MGYSRRQLLANAAIAASRRLISVPAHPSAWLHRHLIPTSMARNAKQINAPVGAEVFSLAQQQCEKYGSRAGNKLCVFNHIKNPYQIPVVQRSREKPRTENTNDAVCGFGSAELRRESSAKRGDFLVVASQERKLATTRLAEGVGFETGVRRSLEAGVWLKESAEDVLGWNFDAGECRTVRTPLSARAPRRVPRFERKDQLSIAHFAQSKNPQPSMPVHKRLLDSRWTPTERFGITS
jgi:hypothetical protein